MKEISYCKDDDDKDDDGDLICCSGDDEDDDICCSCDDEEDDDGRTYRYNSGNCRYWGLDDATIDSLLAPIRRDDVPDFVAKLNAFFELHDFYGVEPSSQNPRQCPDYILRCICNMKAVGCATALLRGQAGVYWDLNVLVDGRFPLHQVAYWLNYDFVDLFLSHGARADVRVRTTEGRDILPLDAAFQRLVQNLYPFDWPEKSIYKLVIILCLPQLKVPLETIRLLVYSTKDVNEVFIDYAEEGKFIEMSVLLLVANKLVMAPSTFQSKDGATVERSMTVHDIILRDIRKVLVGNGENRFKLGQICDGKKISQIFVLALLKLFERAGDAIRSYLRSRQSHVSKEEVVKDVVSILKEAGFVLRDKDIDLSDIDCESDKIKKASGTSEYFTAHNLAAYSDLDGQKIKYSDAEVASTLKEAGFLLKDMDIDFRDIDCKSNEIEEATEASEDINYSPMENWLPQQTISYPVDILFLNQKQNPWRRPPKVGFQSAKFYMHHRTFASNSDVPTSHRLRHFSSLVFSELHKNQSRKEINAVQRSNLLAIRALSFIKTMRRL